MKRIAIVLAGIMLVLGPRAFAQDERVLAIAVGDPGSPSYKIGRGLTSLLETQGLADGTKVQVDTWESLSPGERVVVLFEEAQLAVIPGGDAGLRDPRVREEVRAAAALADGNQVFVRADLSEDLVYHLTQLMFEHPDILRSAYGDLGDLEPAASLERIKVFVHPGAMRYYQEQSEHRAAAGPPDGGAAAPEPPDAKSFTVYFDFDVAEFDFKQIGIVQEACGYAATLPAAEFVLSGHADTVGPEPYNDQLSLSRAQSVASVIRNDPRFRDALNVIKFGEHDLAVPTADEVEEPKNRRVVITVVPGEVDEVMLREIEASAASSAVPRPQP